MAGFLEVIPVGRAGLKVHATSTISRLAAAALDAGLFMVPGADDFHAKLPVAAADIPKCFGVSVYQEMKDRAASGEDYAIQDAVEILQDGEVWAQCETAAAVGDPVFVRWRITAGAAYKKIGACRNDVDTADAVLLANCKFASTKSTAATLGIVKVFLNLPGT